MRTIGLKTWQWNNAVKAVLLLAGFPVLLVILSFALVALVVSDSAPSFGAGVRQSFSALPAATGVALVVTAIWFTIAWFAHQKILDVATGAKRTTRAEEPRLWNLLENLCISRGLPMPALRIIETPALNAFASGLSAEHYTVTVTRGLIEALSDAELEGVLAHELTHIRNGDARLAVVAAVFAGVLSLIPDLVMRSFRFGTVTGGRRRSSSSSSSSDSRGGGSGALAIVAVVLIILVWLLAAVLRFALSRNREYLADAGAVELTKNPDAMISALRKIEGRSDLPAVPDQVRAMFLDDQKNARGGSWWATHPTIAARVAALVQTAGGRDPGPIAALAQPAAEQSATDQPTVIPSPWAQAPAPNGSAASKSPWG